MHLKGLKCSKKYNKQIIKTPSNHDNSVRWFQWLIYPSLPCQLPTQAQFLTCSQYSPGKIQFSCYSNQLPTLHSVTQFETIGSDHSTHAPLQQKDVSHVCKCSINLPVFELYINGIMQYVFCVCVCGWFLSLNIMLKRLERYMYQSSALFDLIFLHSIPLYKTLFYKIGTWLFPVWGCYS